jgi:hypothetical protein
MKLRGEGQQSRLKVMLRMSDGPFMDPRAFMASFMKMVMC